MTLRFRPEVASDLRAARDWYEARQEGLGDEFTLAVERLLERIELVPLQFPRVYNETHRALLRRFPFSIRDFLRDRRE
jgi:hypothetical protein